MDIHNNTEDIVLRLVNDICDNIEKENKSDRPCTCFQCRMDIVCYVLNRCQARYVVSSRGVIRAETEDFEHQQTEADIATLAYEGLQRISKFRRPHFAHDGSKKDHIARWSGPAFNFPTIVGRVFNGVNFEPMRDIDIVLRKDSAVAKMIDPNWQNPFSLVPNTDGSFSFWPEPEPAKAEGDKMLGHFAVEVAAPGYETLRHFFDIDVVAEHSCAESFSLDRTLKLPDLYLFPPGDDEDEV